MPPRHLVVSLLLLSTTACLCEKTQPPVVTGYISRISSPTDLDVSAERILIDSQTKIQIASPDGTLKDCSSITDAKLYLGEPADVYGNLNLADATIAASRIVLRTPATHVVTGSGIVDAMLPTPSSASPQSNDRLLRADGYPILLNDNTKLTFQKPLSSLSDLQTNLWIRFRGTQRPDGVLVADSVVLSENVVSHGEAKLRADSERAAIDSGKKKSEKAKASNSPDSSPAEQAMQARVSAIGARLVPKYQSELPATDPTKINFRFQVIDDPNWRQDEKDDIDDLALPSGIVLVPRQVVERMQNDSQLAAFLADGIACILEKQELHADAKEDQLTGIEAIAGTVVPVLGIATQIATSSAGGKLGDLRRNQSGRVSLTLLHDAGYDLAQAPIAWWLLASKTPQEVTNILMPRRAEYLYQFMSQTWPADSPLTAMKPPDGPVAATQPASALPTPQ
jgi:hypothetical protein